MRFWNLGEAMLLLFYFLIFIVALQMNLRSYYKDQLS